MSKLEFLERLKFSTGRYVRHLEIDVSLEHSLFQKLHAASASLQAGEVGIAIQWLEAFLAEVEAERGGKISEAAAEDLLAQARHILALLSATATITVTPTLPVTETPTPTPTETPLVTETPTATEVVTETPTPTLMETPVMTEIPTATEFPTETPTPTPE